jgi:hypothetical protein
MLAWHLRLLLAVLLLGSAAFGAWLGLVALGTIALLVVLSYALAGLRPGMGALHEFAVTAWMYLVAQPFPAAWVPRDPTHADGKPVLLVHGFFCNRGVWWLLARRLRAAGYRPYALDLEPLRARIDDYVPLLRERIDAILAAGGQASMPVVCHSMGGLAMRAYLRAHGGSKVSHLVTVGSPHHGTRHASLGLGRNARQMETGSAWLRELEAWERDHPLPPTTSIYSAADNIVAPQDSPLLPGASNVQVAGVGHLALLCANSVVPAILRAL